MRRLIGLCVLSACSMPPDPPRPEVDAGLRPGFPCSVPGQDCAAGLSCLVRVDGGTTKARGQCFSGACDVVRQDCGEGEQCGYPPSIDGGPRRRQCYSASGQGLVREGEPCTTFFDCAKGLVCVSSERSATGFLCERFCYDDRGCAEPKPCVLGVGYPGSPEALLYCASPPSSCDVISQAPCVAPRACRLTDDIPTCGPPGTVARDGACTRPTDCERGTICAAGVCRGVCNPDGGAPGCGAEQCGQFGAAFICLP